MLKGNRSQKQKIHQITAYLLLARVASAIAILVGSLVLLGWYFDIELLKQGFPGSLATMKANTALCFVLSGVSLYLSLVSKNKNVKLLTVFARFCAIAVIIIAGITLSQYLFGWDFQIDELLFRDSPTSIATSHPGRMGFNTALDFMLVGLTLEMTVHQKTSQSYWYTQIVTLIAAVISLQALIGYAYNVRTLHGIARNTTSMALHTAVLFILLCMGILWAQTKQGVMRVVMDDTYSGLLARRLLLAAIAVPLILGWLILKGHQLGHYDAAFAISLFTIALIVIFAILIWQSTLVVERLNRQREIAQASLRINEEKLKSFVDANIIGIVFCDVYGGIQQANDEFLRMIGYSREDLLSGKLSWREITPPEYLRLDDQSIAQAKANIRGACTTPYEKEYIRKDGSHVPVLVGYVLLGEQQEEAVGFILDLSDRKFAETEQQKLVSLIENSSDFIGIANFEGQGLYLNDAGQKLVGLTSLQAARQKQILDFFMPEDQAYVQEHILPTLINQGFWHGEFRFCNFQTGEAIPVDYNAFVVKDHKTGQPIALATVTRNITEQKQAQERILQLNRELQRRVAELQTLLEVIPIGIGIAEDPECQTIKVNPAFAKQLGISSEINASLSAPTQEIPTTFKIYRDGRELAPEELPMQYSAAHGIEVIDFEVEIIQEDGKIVNLLEYVAPLFDEEGKTRGCIGAFLDITLRKQAEEILRNQQKWLEDVLNLMPRPLLFIEPGTARVTFANRSADELAGGEFPKGIPAQEYHTAYHFTNAVGDRIPNEQMPGVRVARGERLDGLEVDWHTNGSIRSLLIFADTLPAMHGYPATCVLVFQDVSNLKQAEKALSLGYKRLQLLCNTASDLLSSQQPVALIESVFHKLKEQIGLDVYFNYLVKDNSQVMQLESYYGFTEEIAKQVESLALGQAVCGTVAQERRSIYVENVQQSTEPKAALIRSLGVNAYYSYPLITQGRLMGTLSFGSRTRTFFTENQKGIMQAVCDQIAIAMERAELIASLQQQTEQLREANRMKDEFLAILSHELRSPLNAILGWAQLLHGRKLNSTQIDRAVETIERNARAQTQLVEDLLDISRMIRGKLRLNVHTCDLVPIIESAIETVSLAAQAKEIDLQYALIPLQANENLDLGLKGNHENSELLASKFKLCRCYEDGLLHETKNSNSQFLVCGDAERLQQIIWNLLSNAIKFTPQGGRVEIKLSTISGQENNQYPQPTNIYAQIQVIDTGIGISSEFLPYVFDRFRQADSSSTRPYGGLGLGLAIVRHLVELHGGNIYVDSPGKNQGATFTVQLPLLPPSFEVISTQQTTQASSTPQSFYPSLLGIRVLVVEHEVDTRKFIATVLEQCQADVQAVESVPEALEVIQQWKPNVLVSDIELPQENGYSLIRKLRSQPPEQGGRIPAAAITAHTNTENRVRVIQEGYQLHLPKPIDPTELAIVIASLVERSHS
ncbi:MAG: PAS domain S-box protein [Desmonostoc vinosum HA7617-LM4]|jgi:PAS domain S-box-containing protein|nr:PAS domain S-box protein [Desmonostoc vinosum HA7617-LM4]